MSQSLVFTLLALALVFPILGAIGLRVLGPRLSGVQLYVVAAIVFAVVFASVLMLARANVSNIQIGQLSLLLPAAAPAEEQPAPIEQPPAGEVTPLVQETADAPTGAPTETATTGPSATAAASATAEATETPTPEPTAPPEPTATATPEPPTETPQPAGRRTYVVQPGDTLRAIAEQFNVSVSALLEANNLTPEEADSLRPGQELVIP